MPQQTNPKLAKAACPTCGVNTNDFCSNSWHLSHRGQEEAGEPRADGEYTVSRRWLRKLRDCLRYSFEPGGNLPVAIGMVDHALEGCGAAEPDDVCPVSPREFDLIEKQLEDYAACAGMQAIYDLRMKSVSKINKLRAWLERERV